MRITDVVKISQDNVTKIKELSKSVNMKADSDHTHEGLVDSETLDKINSLADNTAELLKELDDRVTETENSTIFCPDDEIEFIDGLDFISHRVDVAIVKSGHISNDVVDIPVNYTSNTPVSPINKDFEPFFHDKKNPVPHNYTIQSGISSINGNVVTFSIELMGTFLSGMKGNLTVGGLTPYPMIPTSILIGYQKGLGMFPISNAIVNTDGNIYLYYQDSKGTTRPVPADMCKGEFRVCLSGSYIINN